MTTWFSADHHFNHANILKYTKRPFSSIEEMNGTMLQLWNSVVNPKDQVYYLGDLTLGNTTDATNILNRMNGIFYLIEGNHDRGWYNKISENGRIRRIPPLYELKISNQSFSLCHYALRSWNKSHYGAYHLYGHHHGALESYGLSFDVGADTNNFYPYSLNDVIEKMSTLKPIVDFREKNNEDE